MNRRCSLFISWRVLQISRKSTGTDCLKVVKRISSLLCNFNGLKSLDKCVGRTSSTLTHQSFYYLQYKFIYVHESVSRLLLKAGCSNLFLPRWWLCQELQSKSVCNNHRLLLGGRHCLLDPHDKWCTRDWVARSFFFLGKVLD